MSLHPRRLLFLAPLWSLACSGATSPPARDLDAVLALPEAEAFIAAEAALQASAAEGPGELFVERARALGAATRAWRSALDADSGPEIERLATELEAVSVLTGPGLEPPRAADPEVRLGIAAAIRSRLFSLRAYRRVLAPLPDRGAAR